MAPAPPPARFASVSARIARNQTLNQALFALDLAAAEVNGVVEALRGLVPFRKVRPGDQLRLERRADDGELHRFSYRQGPADEWIVERLPDAEFVVVPEAGHMVLLEKPDVVDEALTAGDGHYRFDDLAEGTYLLVATGRGGDTAARVSLAEGAEVQVDLGLA